MERVRSATAAPPGGRLHAVAAPDRGLPSCCKKSLMVPAFDLNILVRNSEVGSLSSRDRTKDGKKQ